MIHRKKKKGKLKRTIMLKKRREREKRSGWQKGKKRFIFFRK
jgi:hypothetical protein